MDNWIQIDQYHLRNGDWTISKSHSISSIYPYGLFHNGKNHGFYKTVDEAKKECEKLLTQKSV